MKLDFLGKNGRDWKFRPQLTVLFCFACRPWILHPVWIIHPLLGFIGFSLKPKVLGVGIAPSTFHLVFQRFLGLGERTIKQALIPTFPPPTTIEVIQNVFLSLKTHIQGRRNMVGTGASAHPIF